MPDIFHCMYAIYIRKRNIESPFPRFLRCYANAVSGSTSFGRASGMLILRRGVIKARSLPMSIKLSTQDAVTRPTINTDGPESGISCHSLPSFPPLYVSCFLFPRTSADFRARDKRRRHSQTHRRILSVERRPATRFAVALSPITHRGVRNEKSLGCLA